MVANTETNSRDIYSLQEQQQETKDILSKHNDDINTLKQETAKINVVVGRLDTAIDRIADMGDKLTHLVTTHDARLSIQETATNAAANKVDVFSMSTEAKLTDAIKTMRDSIDKLRGDDQAWRERFDEKQRRLEKYVWTVSGGLTVLLALLNLPTIISLL